jgi:hypothetical protein
MGNPYAQVALTYVRRPFSTWFGWLGSVFVVCTFMAFAFADRAGGLKDSFFPQLMYFVCFFIFLALHMKGQFVNSRAHLTPGFRRVHATVAAVAAFILAVVLPAALAWFMGWNGLGFVAVVVLLFGTALWVVVKDATWTPIALMLGWVAVCSTKAGPTWLRELLAGQLESQAVVILVLGIVVTLLAGIRLVRLREEMLTYESTLRWDWGWSEKTRQGWSGDDRVLPGLRDWIREREMARATRLARRASESWWSRICRWQVGMAAGWSLGFWILGALIYVQGISSYLQTRAQIAAAAKSQMAAAATTGMTKSQIAAAATMGITSLVLTCVPAMIAAIGVLQWRTFKVGRESLLPVERKSYIRQLVAAAALSHFQLWAAISVALVIWWLLIGPRPVQLAVLGGVLAFSAAFQVVVFGVAIWWARYRSNGRGAVVLCSLIFGSQVPLQFAWVGHWCDGATGQVAYEAMCIAGVFVVIGLAITCDAYRRWLVTELD